MKHNKISVIIPYYNDSLNFERCLKSVLKQTISPHEIIIIDDHSKDSQDAEKIITKNNTSKKIKISYIRNKKNMNGAYSRNKGMQLSTGNFIALLDADDYWLNNHLELSLKGITGSNVDFVYANVIMDSFGKTHIRKTTNIESHSSHPINILLLSPPQTNSFFFKKTILNKISFNEKLKRHQDYQFFIDIITKKIPVKHLNIATSAYCTSYQDAKKKLDFESIMMFWKPHLKIVDEKLFATFIMKMYYMIVRYCPEKSSFFLQQNNTKKLLSNNWKTKILSSLNIKKKIQKTLFIILFNILIDYKDIITKTNRLTMRLLNK